MHHHTTHSSYDSANAAHLASDRVVKGVILRNKNTGKYLLAVIPSDHHIKLSWINASLNRSFALADESVLPALFPDCEAGAVPGLGQAYNMEMVWDDLLAAQPDLYFEGGNHEDLIHITHEQFSMMFKHHPSGRISVLNDYHPAFKSNFERRH